MKILLLGKKSFLANLTLEEFKKRWVDAQLLNSRENIEFYQDFFNSRIDPGQRLVIVNFVGCGIFGTFDELNRKQIDEGYRCNFKIPLQILQAALKKVKAIGWVKRLLLVNLNSTSALNNYPQWIAYASFKAALSRALGIIGKEFGKYWVKVKEIFAPVIDSPWVERMPYVPQKWVVKAEEIVKEVIEKILE